MTADGDPDDLDDAIVSPSPEAPPGSAPGSAPEPRSQSWAVAGELDGERLDVVVAALTGDSRSRAAAAIDDERVTVDGRVRARSHRVVVGEVVAVTPPPPRDGSPPPPLPPIVVDDPMLWVLDKPAGLVVHPGHGHPDGTLADALRAAGVTDIGPDPSRSGIVHRLDKDTSGVMVVARTDAAHAALVAALRDRRVTRAYLTLVQGRLPGSHGRVDVPLGRDDRDRTRFAGRHDGRPAVTHFRVVATGTVPGGAPSATPSPVALVACRLETGRTHQIRVHMAHVGTPVVGDTTYGASSETAARLGLDRTFLHAARIELSHPETGDPVAARAALPTDLAHALEVAGITVPAEIPWP